MALGPERTPLTFGSDLEKWRDSEFFFFLRVR